MSQCCIWCYTETFLVLVFLIPAHLIATYGQFQQLTKYFLSTLSASQLSGATDCRDLANDYWETVTCPPCLKTNHNSSRSSYSASLTNRLPSLHAAWLLCCFIPVLMIPFHLWSVQDLERYWEYLRWNTLSAALQEGSDNWQTGQRKGAEKIHRLLTAWIFIWLYM